MRIVLNPQLRLIMEQGADRRRENLLTSDEVGLIIPDEYGDASFRDICLAYHNGPEEHYGNRLFRISQAHAAYMPLHYVFLFPHGDTGWHWDMRLQQQHRQRTYVRLPQRAFDRYRLHTRQQFVALFYGQRLFQQYLVDAWAACDQNKLLTCAGKVSYDSCC